MLQSEKINEGICYQLGTQKSHIDFYWPHIVPPETPHYVVIILALNVVVVVFLMRPPLLRRLHHRWMIFNPDSSGCIRPELVADRISETETGAQMDTEVHDSLEPHRIKILCYSFHARV
jgi:hypothetical protein